MQGFLLIDKPSDITSFFCVKVLRKISQEKRIGFAGTLDPLATGLMIFALGEMRKLLFYLEGLDKKYEVVICLGATSDTYDAKGNIVKFPNPLFPTFQEIEAVLQQNFSGEREQQPPIYSAIKVEGKRAYDLARKGQSVNLKRRPVTFYSVDILEYQPPLLTLRVHCSSGTYVRSLAHDLGQILGCGGYVEKLRRLAIGAFSLYGSVLLHDLTVQNIYSFLLQPAAIFPEAVQVSLSDSEYKELSHGGFVPLNGHIDVQTKKTALSFLIFAYVNAQCVGVLEPVKNLAGYYKFERQFLSNR